MLGRILCLLLLFVCAGAPSARADLTWSAPSPPVSTKEENGFAPVVGVDANGGAVVAWLETQGGKNRVHVATRTRRGFLGASQTLSAAGVDAGAPKLVVARDGSAVIAWSQDRPGADPNGVYTAVRKPGEAFGPAKQETTNPNEENLRDMAMDAQGNTLLISLREDSPRGQLLNVRRRAAGATFSSGNFTGTTTLWDGAALNPNPTGKGILFGDRITFNAAGDAVIAWTDARSADNDDNAPGELRVAQVNANGTTVAQQLVATKAAGEALGLAGVLFNANRTVITWIRNASGGVTHAEVAYRAGLAGGAFTAPQVVGGAENNIWAAVTPDATGAGVAGFQRPIAGGKQYQEIYFPADKTDFNGSRDLPAGLQDTPSAFDDAARGSMLFRRNDRLLFAQREPGALPTYTAPVDIGPGADLALPDYSSDDRLAVGPDGTAAVAYTVKQGLNSAIAVRFGDLPLPAPPPDAPVASPTPGPTPPPQPDPPMPNAIQVAGKVDPGEAAVLTVNITGAATRVEWFPGTAKSRVGTIAGGRLQSSLRTHIKGQTTVTVKVSGPGGDRTFTRSLTGPNDPKDDKAKAVLGGSPPSKEPVSATGTEDVLTGKATACGPVNVFSGALTISGCMKPVTGLADIPSSETGVLDVINTAYGLDLYGSGAGLLSRATELLDGYVITGPATLNGLWPVTPAGGAKLVAYPQAAALTSSNATVRVAGQDFKPGGSGFNLRLNSDSKTIDLGEVPRPAGWPTLGGFGYTGGFHVQLGPSAATIDTSVKLPDFVQRNGVNVQPDVTLRSSPDALTFAAPPTIQPSDASFGPAKVTNLALTYDKGSDLWIGGGNTCFFGASCLSFSPPAGLIRMRGNLLDYARTSLTFGAPGTPLAPGVFLERLNAGIAVNPTRVFGGGRMSIAGALKLDGSAVFAYPSARTPYTLQRNEVGNGFPASFYANQYTRPLIAAGADVSLALPVLGETKFADGYLLYEVPGYVATGGHIGANILGLVRLDGAMSGEYNTANKRSNLHGDISACLTAVDDDLCAKAAANVSAGIGTEGGAGACAEVGPVSVGAGVLWAHPGLPIIWPIDGCRWSPFKLDVRTRADGPITTVTVEVGKDAKAVRLDGAGDSPQVRVTGPQTLDPAGRRLAYTQDGKVRIVRADTGDAHFTSVGLQGKGTWKIELLPGSAAITQSSQAENPPAAKASGRVTRGRGETRVLRFRVRQRVRQRVSFFDVSPGGGRKLVGTTAGGRGKLSFSPAPDTRRHAVVAAFTLDDLPAEEKPVTTFRPPSPTLTAPRGLKVRRTGTTVTVRWRGVRGATRYELALAAGGQRFVTTPKRTATFTGVAKGRGGTVTVRAVASLRQSGLARTKVKATGRTKRKLGSLKRCTVRRKRVKCH